MFGHSPFSTVPFSASPSASGATVVFVYPSSISSGEAFGTPIVSKIGGIFDVYPTSIDSAESFGVVTIILDNVVLVGRPTSYSRHMRKFIGRR